ncbi:hypothetical protein DAPPUDRAFT_249762 [Daphnia pulex]|uniref:Uncharacterized protein n=1 Tax=Daphnia pulex TaxID=6669 RepID=E9GX96_DAPPU|nr:hypothetical protein DAPPUDRAFT_249762 [Daphnia pulex]|eukprot:EFX75832.1 hypothetical protein DAPPUDRAFT_249762 [Daphnia pulex]
MDEPYSGVFVHPTACQQSSHTITTPTKRKLASDCDEVEDAEIQSRQATLEEAFQPKSAKKKEFDRYVLDYIIEGLLPLKHLVINQEVEEHFKNLWVSLPSSPVLSSVIKIFLRS